MKVIKTVVEMQSEQLKMSQKSIGFVPTMGYFHEGHLSLMKQAKKENDFLIVSVFVNPLQFGPNEDLDTYPRDEERDIRLAEEHDVDILFLPQAEDMYPTEQSVKMNVGERANVLCGKSRPGHFDGVVTVLSKLFNLIHPTNVYLGMKDAQQVAVVDGLIEDFNFPIKLVGLPTVREENGLAKSSRNVYLSDQERNEAMWIQRALKRGQKLVTEGEKQKSVIIRAVKDMILDHTNGTIDYIDLLSYPTLQSISTVEKNVILATAVKFNKVRLIDNIIFNHHGTIVERYH